MPVNTRASLTEAARLRVLYILREAARLDPTAVRDILSVDASVAVRALDSLPVRLAASIGFLQLQIEKLIAEECIETVITRIRDVLAGNLNHYALNFSIYAGKFGIRSIGRCADLERIVGPGYASALVRDPDVVGHAIDSTIQLLEEIWPSAVEVIAAHVDLCAGLEGERGEIRSFSNEHVPGLVSLAVNNPVALLAEELIHEATHVQLGMRIEGDEFLSEALNAMPACYSPFTNSVRPAGRVLHGVVSYGRVLSFWKLLGAFDRFDPLWLDCKIDVDARAVVQRRINELSTRVNYGWNSLVSCASEDEIPIFQNLYEELLQDKPELAAPLKGIESICELLPPIPRAEFLIASQGRKASRFSVRIGTHAIPEAILATGMPCCYSARAFLPKHGQQLQRFSNTFASSCKVLDASPDHEVLCYVGSDRTLVRRAFDLDCDDAAEMCFEIPSCCNSFYRRTWESIRERGGDLFAFLLGDSTNGSTFTIPWQCNAAAMYAGGGICWHFPCSLDCPATIDIVEQRMAELLKLDPLLAECLVALQKQAFFWSPTGGYGFLPLASIHDASISDVRWTGIPPAVHVDRAIDLLANGWQLVITKQ